MSLVDRVASELGRRRFGTSDEFELQDALASVFAEEGMPAEREALMSGKERIDFLLEEGVGIEVKIKGSLTDVTRQLARYADCDRVSSLILVTTRQAHRAVPTEIRDKPIRVVYLSPL